MLGMIRKFKTMTGLTVYTVDLFFVFIEIQRTALGKWRLIGLKWPNFKRIVSRYINTSKNKIIKN